MQASMFLPLSRLMSSYLPAEPVELVRGGGTGEQGNADRQLGDGGAQREDVCRSHAWSEVTYTYMKGHVRMKGGMAPLPARGWQQLLWDWGQAGRKRTPAAHTRACYATINACTGALPPHLLRAITHW